MNSTIKLLVLVFLSAPFTLFAQTWEEAAPFPGESRHHPVTFSIDGFGYLVTGSTNTKDFYRYDPVADAWEQLPDFPGDGRGFSYGVTFEGKGYLGFGRVGSKNYNDLWSYDPMTEEWTELDTLPGVGRAHPALIAGSGKIWVGLGSGPDGNMNDWWEYDIASDTWEEQPYLPSVERHHPYYFVIDGMPYVGFGHGAGIFKDFYQFDFENDSWIILDSFPDQGRVAGTQFSYGGKGYILSGQGEDHGDLETGEFWEYDPQTDTWEELIPHPGGGRWAPGSFVLNGEAYVLCGNQQGVGNLTSMWRGDLPELPVATHEVFLKTELKIVPNPASDFVEIQSDIELLTGAKVSVINLEGKVLMTQDYDNEKRIDIGRLATGFYILKVYSANSAQFVRFVIAR